MNFSGKRVLVTGGSRGIGRAIALDFSSLGAKLAINYCSNDTAAHETLKNLEGEGHVLIKHDLTKTNSAQKIISECIEKLGGIDILINNAAIAAEHHIDEIDFDSWQEHWQQIINTNLFAVVNLSYYAVDFMKNHGGGRIVNVSSRGAFRGEPDMPAYGASKAALNSFSQSMAKKLAKHNIFVGIVAPGFTETEMGLSTLSEKEKIAIQQESPMQRLAKPEEIAKAVLFLASEGAEYMTGSILDVNGASYLRS